MGCFSLPCWPQSSKPRPTAPQQVFEKDISSIDSFISSESLPKEESNVKNFDMTAQAPSTSSPTPTPSELSIRSLPWSPTRELPAPPYPYPAYAANPPSTTPRTASLPSPTNTRWKSYLDGTLLIYNDITDKDPSPVQTGELIPLKPLRPWIICLVHHRLPTRQPQEEGDKKAGEERHFYLLAFLDSDAHSMQRRFPPNHVFVPWRGFLPLAEAKAWCADHGGRYMTECDFAAAGQGEGDEEGLVVDVPGWPKGWLITYAGMEMKREGEEWDAMSEGDRETVRGLVREEYGLEVERGRKGGEEYPIGHHWLDVPSPARVAWKPKDQVRNALPMGWKAWVRLTTGEVVYFDQLAKKTRSTHPSMGFRTEGLPRSWQMAWAKVDGQWVVYYRDHDKKVNTLRPGTSRKVGSVGR
ncbi:hypothetical protein BDZ85DRAFT_321479 [Elsinoe ampelina]|uniref:Uncharacterized protein n=1 Tax=Elsinoe ampelina TaxID=302913 RepID=A0A6A6G4N3_9PEZI|nr:hypothetical protein BDZ85DRAFT_321479 [Elsinoe ampelina]